MLILSSNAERKPFNSMYEAVKLMKPFLAQRGFISEERGAQIIRELYREGTTFFPMVVLSDFGYACLYGDVDRVKKMVDDRGAPDLTSTETPYQHSYAQLTIIGVTYVRSLLMGPLTHQPKHYETLEYLIAQGVPLDKPDIIGRTALHHAVESASSAVVKSEKSFVGLLLESGASVDSQNRFGETPLINSIILDNKSPADVEWLMKYGADIDLADADGITTRNIYLRAGPQITAAIQKWIRKRDGQEDAPRTEKACNGCATKKWPLLNCTTCKVARYCSRECQRIHWQTHKKTCIPFNMQNTVTLHPTYPSNETGFNVSISDLTRGRAAGNPVKPKSKAHAKRSNVPGDLSTPKSMVIKVQVPPIDSIMGYFVVYTKKRDFECTIWREDGAEAYDAVLKTVRAKGVEGLKAYFAAELRGEDELVVKIAEVLACQPF